MKKLGVLISLMVITVFMLAPASFAADDTSGAAVDKAGFRIDSSTPDDGAKGVSVENLSVKIYFSKEMLPESKSVRAANSKQFKLTDKKGHNIPIKVYYSHKESKDGLMMVVSDVIGSDIRIEGNTDYILTIGKGLQASDGTKLGVNQTISFKTLDQSRSTMVYMIMMFVMIAGMIFFTSRSAKKAMEKEKETKGKTDTVNPYKEAKRTGKSVEEIVEKDKKRKAKQAEALAKRKAAEAELEAEEEERERAKNNKRVSAPKPISAAGSEYKVKVVKTQKPQPKKNRNKGNTNPKKQTGKQKNSKSKSKKKKK